MNISLVKITNMLGVGNLEITPGRITEISGANGSGKTSVLEAIKSIFGGGHDATLLRNGAEKGEAVIVLEDGVEIKRTVTAEKTTTTVKHPQYGKLGKPAEYLKKLTDALSVNPVEFLTAKPKERTAALLGAMPLRVEAAQVGFMPVDVLNSAHINFDDHAMVVLETLCRATYDARTGVNRSLKDKQAMARQLVETVPEAPVQGDWETALCAAETEYNALRDRTAGALREIKKAAEAETASAETGLTREKEEARARANAEFDLIQKKLEREIEELTLARDGAVNATREIETRKRTALESEYRPLEAELKERIGHARAMFEREVKAAETRKLASRMEDEARKLSEESERLTAALSGLEKLKSSLLASLPVAGLEVRDGEIFVDGVPFDRVNESARVRLAIEVAKLRAGELGLIAVDGLECMDSATFAEFEKAAVESGLQFVISRVADTPLTVTTREAA
jgi:exonuclease SbcC